MLKGGTWSIRLILHHCQFCLPSSVALCQRPVCNAPRFHPFSVFATGHLAVAERVSIEEHITEAECFHITTHEPHLLHAKYFKVFPILYVLIVWYRNLNNIFQMDVARTKRRPLPRLLPTSILTLVNTLVLLDPHQLTFKLRNRPTYHSSVLSPQLLIIHRLQRTCNSQPLLLSR